jgi:1-acyl-sn-glycerol-3-phosphate acyltransferase
MSTNVTQQRVDDIPAVSQFLYRGFAWYSRRLVARRFDALRVVMDTVPEIPAGQPLLVYGNHSSWWDPLVAVLVNEQFFSPRQFHAPIDAAALQGYAVLKRLGFYPVTRKSASGARDFCRKTKALLTQTNTAVYITPQGRFVDVRDEQPFETGLAHVASRLGRGAIVPMAVEYTFWNESTPEILVEFGGPFDASSPEMAARTKTEWNDLLERELRRTQFSLARKGMARDPAPFKSIIRGRVGEGGLYDVARRLKTLVVGKRFRAAHDVDAAARGAAR